MENTALQTTNETRLSQIGDTSGKLGELAGLIAGLLGENFKPTLPATDYDAGIILDWLRSGKKAECPNTRREYLRDLTHPATGFLTFIGGKPLSFVSRQDTQNFRRVLGEVTIPATDRREAHSLAVSTQRRMMASVKGLLTHASGIGLLQFNAGKGVALPSLPSSKRDKALRHSDSLRMLMTAQHRAEEETGKRRAIRRRDYLLNKLCYLTGGRISEITHLKWAHLYATDAGGEWKLMGKGSKERLIRIPPELFAELMAERGERQATDDDYVFVSAKGKAKGKPLSISQCWRIITDTAKAAGLQKKVSPHSWRHSLATQLLDGGAPLHEVSNFLGHSDPKITVQAYYHSDGGLKVEKYIEL